MATNTHPGPWWQEEDEMVLTVLQVLRDQDDAVTKKTKGRR